MGRLGPEAAGHDDVVAIGPSVYGFTGDGMTTERATWTARLYDATTNTFSAWAAWSQEYYVTAKSGINFNSPHVVLPGVHGHQQYVQVLVEWLNTAGTAVVGLKDWYVSTYYISTDLGGYPMSYC